MKWPSLFRSFSPRASASRTNFVAVPAALEPIETRSAREVEPAAGGLDRARVEAIWGAAQRLFRTRTQPALALAVRRRGQLVLERAIGHARANVLATPRTPFCTFSISKSVTAVVMHMLDERDRLRLDDPVCEYIPEFARNGKEWVTIRHVLTHRAGIPSVTSALSDPLAALTDPEAVLAALCDAKPAFLPGRRLAYHAITGGFVLGEIVRRVTGQGIDRYALDEPAGLAQKTPAIAYWIRPRTDHPRFWSGATRLGLSTETAHRSRAGIGRTRLDQWPMSIGGASDGS